MSEKDERDIEITDSEAEPAEEPEDEARTSAESDDSETPDAADMDEVPAEEAEAERLQARIDELEDQLLRIAADFENYRKRTARQYEQQVKQANERLLSDLLEIVDNFERALSTENGENTPESFRKGVEMIFIQLTTLLTKYDVTPIEAVGQPFDPNLHEAVMQVDSDDYGEGMVALEVSKGYMLGDKVLRHSKVGVSRG
ncbi:nucleotide exchange factor GrpE [candidate division GN15 bacterium]|nr:nucleotide exchange factor GrpE [candidate division GN15 bacterium]